MTRQNEHRAAETGAPHRAGRRRRAGMTLIELMVSTAILAMMILIVAELLAESRHTVQLAQTAIEANANARAIADRLRRDLASIDRDGFLAILNDAGPRRHLVFTVAGSFHSMCREDMWANAARIDWGMVKEPHRVDDMGTPEDEEDDIKYRILYRRAILHNPNSEQTYVADEDHHKLAVTYYRSMPQAPVDYLNDWLFSPTHPGDFPAYHPSGNTAFPCMTTTEGPDVKFPVGSLGHLKNIWPYVVAEVTDYKVQWTDGSLDGHNRLKWFDNDPAGQERHPGWEGRKANRVDNDHPMKPEYNCGKVGNQYTAMWTFRKKQIWPKALRVQIELGVPPRRYETIVPLPN